MALELDFNTQRAYQQVDALGTKIEQLGPIAQKAGKQVQSAFGRAAYRDVMVALAGLRREYEKVLAAQAQLRRATESHLKVTASVAAAVNAQTHSQRAAQLTLQQLNATMAENVGFAKLVQRETLILAQVKQRELETTRAQAAATAQVTAANKVQVTSQQKLTQSLWATTAAQARNTTLTGAIGNAWAGATSQMRAGNQAAAALRGGLYASNLGIGVFTGSTILAGATVYSLVAAMRTTVSAGAQFEQTFERVVVMVGATDDQISALRETILGLGKDTQFSSNEVAGAALELSLAGLTATEVMEVLDDVVTLAAVAMFDLKEAAAITINTMNAFNIPAKEMGHVVDVMAYAANESSITLKDFANTLKYAGPAAASSGTRIEELSAAIIVLGNAGIKGSSAGTALRRVFVAINRPTAMASKALADLGVQLHLANGQTRSMIDIFEQLANKGARSMDLIRIFGIHAFSAVSVLLRQSGADATAAGKSLRAYAEEMTRLDGVAKLMQEALEDNLIVSFKKLKATIESIQIQAFSQFGEDVKEDVDELRNSMVRNSKEIADALAGMTSAVVRSLLFLAKNLNVVLALAAGFLAWKTYSAAAAVLGGTLQWVGLQAFNLRKVLIGGALAMGAFNGSVVQAARTLSGPFAAAMAVVTKLTPWIAGLSLLAQVVMTGYAAYQAYSLGATDAADSTSSLGVEALKTSDELAKLGKNQLDLEAIQADKSALAAADAVAKWRAEIQRLNQVREDALKDTRQVIETGHGRVRTIGHAPDMEAASRATKDLTEATAQLRVAEEARDRTVEYGNVVKSRQIGLSEEARQATNDELETLSQYTKEYDSLLEKLNTEAETIGLSTKALDAYNLTHGKVADTIQQSAFAVQQEFQAHERNLQATKDLIAQTTVQIKLRKEKGQSDADLLKGLDDLYKREKLLQELVDKGHQLKGKELADIVAEIQLRTRALNLIKEAIEVYEALTGSLAPFNRKIDEINEAMAALASGTLSANEVARQFGVSVQTINEALPKMRFDTAMQGAAGALEKMFPALSGIYEVTKNLNMEVPKFAEFEKAAQAVVVGLNVPLSEQQAVLAALLKAFPKVADKAEKFGYTEEELAKMAKKANYELEEQIKFLKLMIVSWKGGAKEVERNKMAWEKFHKTYAELDQLSRSNIDSVMELLDELERIEELQGIWDDFLDGIDQAFEDVFTGAIDSFTEFRDQLLNEFKKMIGKMIYTAAKNQIILSIQGAMNSGMGGFGAALGSLFGMSAAPGTAGAAVAAGSGGSLLAPLALFSSFGTGLGAFFGGGAHSISAIYGSGGAAGIGGVAGYAAGGALAGGLTGNLVNNLLGGGGSPGQTNTLSAVGGAAGAVIGSQIGSIGGPLGALIGGAIGGLVSNMLGGAQEVIDRGLRLAVNQGRVGGDQFATIREDGGWFGSDHVFTRRGPIKDDTLDTLNATLGQAFGLLSATATGLGQDGSFFSNFSAPQTTISTRGLSPEQAAEKIAKWLNDVLRDAITGFLDQATTLSQTFKNVVNSFSKDTEEFIRAFELMAAISLTSAVDPLVKSLTDYTNAQKTATAIYYESVTALNELTTDFDLNLASLEELGLAYAANREMAYQLAYALRQVRDEVTAMFAGTAETIRQALMTPEELYAYQDTRVDTLVDMLTTLTDPVQIMNAAAEINSLVDSMFGSLDEAQQQLLGPEYLSFLDEITTLAQTQIDEALQAIGESAQTIDLQIDTTLFDAAAARQLEAANALLAAAEALAARFDAREAERLYPSEPSPGQLNDRDEVGPIPP